MAAYMPYILFCIHFYFVQELNLSFTELERKVKSLHTVEGLSYTAVISLLKYVQQLLCIIDEALEG